MKLYRSADGFGLLQVMIGTVVLGIFAMVFVRKAQNRADVSLLTELITYRDQVLDYYSAVVQSRTAWQCTRKCGSPTTADTGFNLYDGDANCQFGCSPSSPTKPTLRLPSFGWRFSHASLFDPSSSSWPRSSGPVSTSIPDEDTHPFFVQAKWQIISSVTNEVKVTISVSFTPGDEWKKKYTTMDIGERKRVFYMNRTPHKNCSDGLAARVTGGSLFFDDRGVGTGVERYAGDTAVVSIDATTGLVNCWNSPLVIPPCYEPDKPPFTGHSTSRGVSFTAAKPCDRFADKGLCPKIGSGTTGITYFDSSTGVSHCGTRHILMVEKSGNSGVNCGLTGSGGLVGVSTSGEFICSNDSGAVGGTGVEHNDTTSSVPTCSYGIRGWDGSGKIKCANSSQVTYGDNIAFNDGYWVGDKGDTGCTGDSISSDNCCEFPHHSTNIAWASLTLPTTCNNDRKNCQFNGLSTLKDDFKGCVDRTCPNHGCKALADCEAVCLTCRNTRWSQDTTCRNYRTCRSNCSTCRSDNSKCSSDRSAYSSCESTRRNCESDLASCVARDDPDEDCGSCDGCSSEYSDLDDCLDTECSTECNCGSAPTCPPSNLSDCIVNDCNDSSDTDKSERDSDECASVTFTETESPLTGDVTTQGAACSRCNTYNSRCATAERESRDLKPGATITLLRNTSCLSNHTRTAICP